MADGDRQDGRHAGSQFPATRWTLIGRAGRLDESAGPVAITEIVRLYAPALRAHLLHVTNRDEHRADDLLQGFLAEKVLEQQLIGHADPRRGRFRTFLLTALDRYVIDEHRHAAARKRSPTGAIADIDGHRETLPDERSAPDRAAAFDAAWAREVVSEVVAAMRAQCERDDRADLWDVFEVRYLRPAMEDVPPEPHESIAARLKLDSAHAAGNLLVTAKRMFTRQFKAVVSRYAADEEEARAEVTELSRLFFRRAG